jgi:hypothetical protein
VTILDLYRQTARDLEELEAARLRLLGRADALAELCEAGLGATEVGSEPERQGPAASDGTKAMPAPLCHAEPCSP